MVYVVDDEEDILDLVEYNLEKERFLVDRFTTGEDVLYKIKQEKPDIILLDLMLPGIDGLEVCKTLKKDPEYQSIPIIMLTAKGEESDIVTGLELGADDYIPKPFSPKVLIARVKAVLRRKDTNREDTADSDIVKIHDIIIHPGRHEVKVD